MDRSIVTRLGLALATLALAAVLLVNLQSPGAIAGAGGAGTAARGAGTAAGGSGSGSSGTATGGSGYETLTGSLVMTRYGPVQVNVTLANRKITTITAVALPSGGRSGMISSIVEPMLQSEALTAQSAAIDIVSGATYTSRAYAASLQAALDSAG